MSSIFTVFMAYHNIFIPEVLDSGRQANGETVNSLGVLSTWISMM